MNNGKEIDYRQAAEGEGKAFEKATRFRRNLNAAILHSIV